MKGIIKGIIKLIIMGRIILKNKNIFGYSAYKQKTFQINKLDEYHIGEIVMLPAITRNFIVHKSEKLIYRLFVTRKSKIKININVLNSNSNLDIKILSISNKPDHFINCGLTIHFQASNSNTKVEFISLVGECGDISNLGNLKVSPNIQNIKAHLMQNAYYLGENGKIQLQPELDLHSHEIEVSHGVKIEKFSQTKLDFLNSKGLNKQESYKLIISSIYQDFWSSMLNSDTNKCFLKLLRYLNI